MKKSRNDFLYKVGKHEQFTDSMKANKLPKVKNYYFELACRAWCNAVAYPFCANCQQRWPLSECKERHWFSHHIKKKTAVTKHPQFAKWNAVYLLPFPHFLISLFPISHFLISHFLTSHFSFLISSFLLLEWPPQHVRNGKCDHVSRSARYTNPFPVFGRGLGTRLH